MTGPSCQSAAASHSYLLGRKLDAELGDDGSEGWDARLGCAGSDNEVDVDSAGLIGCTLGTWLCIGSCVFEDGKVLCAGCCAAIAWEVRLGAC
jgi:hypothetical protein